MKILCVTLLLVASLSVTACGRKGQLAPPPGSASMQMNSVETGSV